MNPANYYYGYNPSLYAYPPQAYPPQAYPYPAMQTPMYPLSPPQHLTRPLNIPSATPFQHNNFHTEIPLSSFPPHTIINSQIPRRTQVYRNMQNDFSRGFEFDYDFLPSERSTRDLAVSPISRRNRILDYRTLSKENNDAEESYKRTAVKPHFRSRSLKTPKLIKTCQKQMSKAGILFTAMINSMCDCVIVQEHSLSNFELEEKLLQAFDGSRLDLSKLTLPHDRLLTEESMENLEFRILEDRANRLEKEENSFFNVIIKRK